MDNLEADEKVTINYLVASLLYGLALVLYIAAIIFSHHYRKKHQVNELEDEEAYKSLGEKL